MACVRGRCPCWPQAERFDAAEMALLSAIRIYMWRFPCSRDKLWLMIQQRCEAVRPGRRAYALSTCVQERDGDCCSITILGWGRMTKLQLEWLVNQGVCPNLWGVWTREFSGWTKGSAHPGRPVQTGLVYGQLQYGLYAQALYQETVGDLLLAAGAYPVVTGSVRVVHAKSTTTLLRQWHAWHARASRRVWAASNLS